MTAPSPTATRAPVLAPARTLAHIASLAAMLAAPLAVAQSPGWHKDARPPVPASDSLKPHELFSYAGQAFDLDPGIQSPEAFLGHALGERFTRHHQMVAYLEYLATTSDRVAIKEYGRSYQGRPLLLLHIAAPENLRRLDQIARDNAALTDPRSLAPTDRSRIIQNNPAIAWLSYNVHGNEPSCTETALQLAYTLAAARDERVRQWINDLIVVIDPCLNPDGRERYLAFYDTNVGLKPDATPWSSEHEEPWPGGRSNHYFFDLNRDWLWGTQIESVARVRELRAFRPQLHADYHEQGYRAPYFFGAGDTPYHAAIPRSTRDWLDVYATANARRFDELGLPYFTKEQFDYLYPGYGKVLPVYHGAVGLLTEQAGHSRGGLAIELDERNILTLFERVRNHFVTSVSNLEATAQNRAEQLERFAEFFESSVQPDDTWPAAFVIAPDNDPALLRMLWELCELHGIEIHTLREAATLREAFDYESPAKHESVHAPRDSWILRSDQPMGRLVLALFAAGAPLENIDTYDITAWAVPAAWGLRAWSVPAPIIAPMDSLASFDWPPPIRPHAGASPWTTIAGRVPTAIIVPSDQHIFPRAAALAAEHKLFARIAGRAITLDGASIPAGSLIVYRIRNDADPIHRFQSALDREGVRWRFAFTSFQDEGVSLASNRNRRFIAPRIALVRGEGVSSLSYGHLWHLLDSHMPMPYHQVNAGSLTRGVLDEVNVIVLPESTAWARLMSSSQREALGDWVRQGGTLIAIGPSAIWAGRELLGLSAAESTATTGATSEENSDETTARAPANQLSFDERTQRSIEDRVPGALVRIRFDETHPLAAGLQPWCGVIKRSTRTLPLAPNGYAIARIDADAPVLDGYLSERNAEALKGQAWISHHRLGRGQVIAIADDPALRGFTHAAARALLNAIIYAPSL